MTKNGAADTTEPGALRAIVFDFDGVLADSMPQHAESYRRVLAPYGIRPEDREIFALEGARSESIIRHLLAQHGDESSAPTDADIGALADEKQATYRALGDPRLYDDTERLVVLADELAPKLGLVTGTRRENLERLIPGLLARFDAVLAQDAYSHDKPHPEPYARAAEHLGEAPERCLAVENATRGVESAKAAGYGHVVAIMTTMPEDALRRAGADDVVKDHVELADLLDRVFAERVP